MTARAKRQLTRLAVVVGLIGLGLTVWALWSFSSASNAAQSDAAPIALEWYDATPTSFDVQIIATGELEARNQIEVKSKVSGSTAITRVVEEGSRVKAGDELVKLDDSKIITDLNQQQIEVEQARASLEAAQRDLELARQDAVSKEKAARVKLAMAEIGMEKWRHGDVIQKRRELDLDLVRAQRGLKTATDDLALNKKLRAENFISQKDLEESELEAITAEDALITAQQNIEVYNKYTFEQENQKNQSEVEQAGDELAQTMAQNQIRTNRATADVDSKQRTLDLRLQKLADQQRELENTTILAPSDGLVVYATSVGRNRRNDDPIQQGRQVRFDETIILLPDTTQLVAALRVHESVVSQVVVDQRTAVRIDARPGEPVEGRVLNVGVMAVDGGWINPQLREYIVKVALPEGFDASLKPAMRCTGSIFIDRVENALAVPVQAVHAEGRRHYLFVADTHGEVRRRSISLGRSSETLVEITQGLNSGDRILLRNPQPGEVAEEPHDSPEVSQESAPPPPRAAQPPATGAGASRRLPDPAGTSPPPARRRPDGSHRSHP